MGDPEDYNKFIKQIDYYKYLLNQQKDHTSEQKNEILYLK